MYIFLLLENLITQIIFLLQLKYLFIMDVVFVFLKIDDFPPAAYITYSISFSFAF